MIKQGIFLLIVLSVLVSAANKDEWKKRSIYQVLTDRFARNDGTTPTCANLGTLKIMQAIIAEEATRGLLRISTISRAWALTPSGFLLLLITGTEGIMAIGPETSTNSMITSELNKNLLIL